MKVRHWVGIALVLGCWFLIILSAHAQYNWQDSPYNYKNSEYNPQNSPYSYDNSPYNPKNSQYNYANPRANGVYDNEGNRVGYVVDSQEGVRNYFNNDGQWIGYGRTK